MNERTYVDVATPLPDALPLGTLPVNPRVTSMQVRSELNAGYTDGAVGLDLFRRDGDVLTRAPILEQPHNAPAFAHVTFYYDGVKVFTGRALRMPWDGGGFAAMGYGVTGTVDGVIQAVAPGDPAPDGALLRTALGDAAPFLSAASGLAWVEPATKHNPGEIRFVTPRDALGLVMKATGQSWVVWDDRTVQLLNPDANVPGEPDYHVPFDPTVTGEDDYSEVYSHVLLIITGSDDDEYVREIPSPDLSAVPLSTPRYYPLHSQAENTESAILVAQEWLRQHARPQVTASIVRESGRGLERVTGGEAPQYTVRPGQWLQVANRSMQRITGADWDGWRQSLSVTLGQPSPGSIIGVIAQASRDAKATGNGRDAFSLGRVRR